MQTPLVDMLPDPDECLADGWHRNEPVSDTIAGNYLATLSHRLATHAGATGGRSLELEHADLFDMESAYVFDNIVICRGPLGDAKLEEVTQAADAFFPTDRSWTMLTLDSRTDLGYTGLELLGHPPLMYRAAGGEAPAPPPELEIRAVRTEQDLADFENTLVAAYPLPRGSSVVDRRILETDFTAWTAYVDGRPVATAGSHTAHGLTEVEWVATMADARGNGYGEAVTWKATLANPNVPAVLIATDPGRPVYERIGFIAMMRLTMWAKPAIV
jgi:hypothetical protein